MQRGFSDLVVDRCVLVVERARLLRCDDSEPASIGIPTPEAATKDLDDEGFDAGGTKASPESDESSAIGKLHFVQTY